jgi:hypothetical protein
MQTNPIPRAPRAPHAPRAPRITDPVATAARCAAVVVVVLALTMSAPSELYMAHLAGYADPWAYGAPGVLTLYAAVAAALTSRSMQRRTGWHLSSVVACAASVAMAIGVQTTAHLIGLGYLPAHTATLVVAVTAVPGCAAAHLMHLLMHRPADVATVPDAPVHRPVHTPEADSAPAAVQPVQPVPAPRLAAVRSGARDEDQDARTVQLALPGEPPRICTVPEAIRWTGANESTVRSWIRRGRLATTEVDGRVCVELEKVRELHRAAS